MADNDITKMKVADLKKELKNRGKSTVGNKTELTERLQAAFIEGDSTTVFDESVLNDDILDDDELNDELDDEASHDIDSNHEDAVLKTPPPSIKSKSPEPISVPSSEMLQKKVILKRKLNITLPSDVSANENPVASKKTRKISVSNTNNSSLPVSTQLITDETNVAITDKKIIKLSELTAKQRLELRAKKFGAPVATQSIKAARSERFGLTTTASDDKTTSNSGASTIKTGNTPATNVDLLKKRAERFGGSVSKVMNKIENLEKLQKRSERFGKADENKVTISGGSSANESKSEKARMRLDRFTITV